MSPSKPSMLTVALSLAALWSNCAGFPLEYEYDNDNDTIVIDQRQNGTENYRINVDGVVIAIADAGTLLGSYLDDFDLLEEELDGFKPQAPNGTEASVALPAANGTEIIKTKRWVRCKRCNRILCCCRRF